MLLHAMVCTKAFRWARRCWVFFQKVTWTLVCILGIYQKGCCFNIQAAVFSMCLAYAECAFVLKLSSNFGWISVCRGAATDIHWGNWQWLSLSWSQGHPRSDADDSWNLEKGESKDEKNPTWSVLRLRWACFVPLQLESTLPSCHVSLPGLRSLMFYHSLIHCTPCQDMATLSRIPRMNCWFWVGFCISWFYFSGADGFVTGEQVAKYVSTPDSCSSQWLQQPTWGIWENRSSDPCKSKDPSRDGERLHYDLSRSWDIFDRP